MKKAILIFLTVLIIGGCNKNVYDNAAKYIQKDFTKQYGNCSDSSNVHCASVKMIYPLFTFTPESTIKDTLNKYVLDKLLYPVFEKKYTSMNDLVDSLFEDYKRTIKEFPSAPIRYELERDITVLTNQQGIICLEYKEYSYLGGAHPNGIILFDNFDLSNGKKITFSEIFKPGYETELNLITEKEFRKIRELKPDENLELAGFWFKNSKFLLTGNFAILKNGLIFYFNDYEIGPHVMGSTEIFIAYSYLKHLLKENGPVEPLARE